MIGTRAPRPMRDLLTGGDRRSIGRVPRVVAILRQHPERVGELVRLLSDADPIVRMRAADALEKASVASPTLLQPHKGLLLALARRATQQELRWHLAQLIPRLSLSGQQRRAVARLFQRYLKDRSIIVRTCAMQALADLAAGEPALRRRLVPQLKRLSSAGPPAVRARSRRLLARLAGRRNAVTLVGRIVQDCAQRI